MSLFDTYRTSRILHCPVCNQELYEWQGKDGPCGLFTWLEGSISPIGQSADDVNLAKEDREKIRLPERFEIYSYDCGCPYPVEAMCTTKNQVWVTTKITDLSNVIQKKHETKSEFKRRLQWLKNAT